MPIAAFNPATFAAVSSALKPLAQTVSTSLSKLGPTLGNYNPAKMAQTFSANPKLAPAMQNVMQTVRQVMDKVRGSEAFSRLCTQAGDYAIEHGLSAVGGVHDEKKNAFLMSLFPPGAHGLSRENISGNISSVSAMVGKERWHAIQVAGENTRVTQTEWKAFNKPGYQTCKTWEPGQQKTWHWIQNPHGDKIALGEEKKMKDGSRQRVAFTYPAGGGPIERKIIHIDANNTMSFRTPTADTVGHKRQEATSTAIVEQLEDDEVPAQKQAPKKTQKQIEAAPASSQELVRRPPAEGSRAS